VLLRHVSGNLNQWIVDGILENPNNRNRRAEFESNVQTAPEQLIPDLWQVVASASTVLMNLELEELSKPRKIQGFESTVLGAIMHSIPHFVGHAHQIVQLTRMQLGGAYQYHWDPEGPRTVIPL